MCFSCAHSYNFVIFEVILCYGRRTLKSILDKFSIPLPKTVEVMGKLQLLHIFNKQFYVALSSSINANAAHFFSPYLSLIDHEHPEPS